MFVFHYISACFRSPGQKAGLSFGKGNGLSQKGALAEAVIPGGALWGAAPSVQSKVHRLPGRSNHDFTQSETSSQTPGGI
jgi:hypothetical protein